MPKILYPEGSTHMTIVLSAPVKDAVMEAAFKNRMSLSGAVNRILEQWLDANTDGKWREDMLKRRLEAAERR